MSAARTAARRSASPRPTTATPSSRSSKRPPSAAPPSQVEINQVRRRDVVRRRVLVVGMIAVFAGVTALCTLGRVWADDAPAAVDYTKIPPLDLVKNTPQGKLTNPSKDPQTPILPQRRHFLFTYASPR